MILKTLFEPCARLCSAPLTGGAYKISWKHDCAAETTEFTIEGDSNGWLGFGLSNGELSAVSEKKMPGADFYLADASGTFRDGFLPSDAASGEPLEVPLLDELVENEDVVVENGKIKFVFERPWDAPEGDLKHAQLTAVDKLNVLIARHPTQPNFARQHPSKERFAIPKYLDLFPAVSHYFKISVFTKKKKKKKKRLLFLGDLFLLLSLKD